MTPSVQPAVSVVHAAGGPGPAQEAKGGGNVWNEAERMGDMVCSKGLHWPGIRSQDCTYDPGNLGQVLNFPSSERIGSHDVSPSLRRQIASQFRQRTLWGISDLSGPQLPHLKIEDSNNTSLVGSTQ